MDLRKRLREIEALPAPGGTVDTSAWKRYSENLEAPRQDTLVIDASCFLNRTRLSFLVDFLRDSEIDPSTLIVGRDLVWLLIHSQESERKDESLSEVTEKIGRVYGIAGRSVLEWMRSPQFRDLVAEIIRRKVITAEEIVGPEETKAISEGRTIGERLVLLEARAAQRAKTFALALGGAIKRVLEKAKYILVEYPLAKKKKFVLQHPRVGRILLFLVPSYVAKNVDGSVSQDAVQKALQEVVEKGAPIVGRLLEETSLQAIAQQLHILLTILGTAAITFGVIAVAFDSISVAKTILR